MVTAPIAAPAAASGSTSFVLAEKAGEEPASVVGLPVIEFATNQLAVLMGQGNGRFTRHASVSLGHVPSALALDDLNQDDRDDVAVVNLLSDDMLILLGNGTGRFERRRSIPVGDQPTDVVIGDLTGDGVPDLAMTNFGDHRVSILRGRGDGTFRVTNTFGVGINPTGLAVGDFDGDGWLDLATSNFGTDDVTILRNQGEGRFFIAQTLLVGLGPMDIVAGDFNGDGRSDLATANFLSNDVSLLTNERGPDKASQGGAPSLRFRVARTLSAGQGPVALAAGAFLGERLGLAVANRTSGEVTLWLGDEGGLAARRQQVIATPAPVGLTVGDFNGDGRIDLAVLDLDGVTLRVLLDNGDGTFRLAP